MISPFESGITASDAVICPERLVDSSRCTVSRLEFSPINKLTSFTETHTSDQLAGPAEGSMNHEISLLNARLQVQEEQLASRLAEAQIEARCVAEQDWKERLEKRVEEERAKVKDIADRFQAERARYFAALEREVVKLALAIAARVLHREARLDPLLLSGVVRVALDRLADNSSTTLHVPDADLAMWKATRMEEGDGKVEVVGEDRLARGECYLDTKVGLVELGVEAQLQEIEKGFFDLLQQRPA